MRIISFVATMLCFALNVSAGTREYAFGAGAVSGSLAGAGIASISGAAATYLNPANLARCKRSSFEFGLRYATMQLSAKQGEGGDKAVYVGHDVLDVELGGCAQPIEGLGIGIWTSNNMLRPLSLSFTTPTEDIYFARYGNSLGAPTLMAGIGYSFVSQVSLGLGVLASIRTQLAQDVFSPLPGSTKIFSANLGATVAGRASVIAGLAIHPWDFISFGGTFRTENYGELEVDARFQASALGIDIPPIHDKLSSVHDYTPQQFAAGFTVKPISELSIMTDVTYALWGKYKGPFLSVKPDPESSLSTGIPIPVIRFKNVLVPRIAAELVIKEKFAVRAGYSYHPRIIGPPRLLTNLVDNGTHQVTLGGGYQTQNAVVGLKADVFVGLDIMPEGAVNKSAVVKPSSYTFGGLVLATGANAAVEF